MKAFLFLQKGPVASKYATKARKNMFKQDVLYLDSSNAYTFVAKKYNDIEANTP